MVGNPDHDGRDTPPLSSSSSSPNNSTIVAGAQNAPVSERGVRRILPPKAWSKAASQPGLNDKGKDDDIVDASAILQHPLTALVVKTFNLSSLPRIVVKHLTDKIKYYDEDRNQHFLSNPMTLWDSELGFKDFCETRITQAVHGRTPTADAALASIRNVAKKAEGKQWPGWFQWREKNIAACTPIEHQLTPEQVAKGYRLEIINGVPTLIAPDSEIEHDIMPNFLDPKGY